MSNLEKPHNDWAKCLYILMQEWMAGVSIGKVLTKYEPYFHKFQSRLGEIEKAHPKLIVSHVRIPYTSRLDGKKKSFMQYTLISPKPYVINLYNKINREGFKGKTNTPNEI